MNEPTITNVQPIERHVAVVAVADPPGEDAVALVLVGRLGERATAGHPAPAQVEPVTRQLPTLCLSHGFLFESRLGMLAPGCEPDQAPSAPRLR
jgi:hypothetical protein